MSRFFVPQEAVKGKRALIVGAEAHHILDVLRLKRGDAIQFFDGTGKVYCGHIQATGAKKVEVDIEEIVLQQAPPALNITLVQSLPRRSKIEYVIEKCTELGVGEIIPTQTARTVVRLDQQRAAGRLLRWRKIAQEAAKQCGRSDIPAVSGLIGWSQALESIRCYDLKLLPCLEVETTGLKDILRSDGKKARIAVVIGPEGGFTFQEIAQAEDAGCIPISLANNVLKSDTAAIAVLAMLGYELAQ